MSGTFRSDEDDRRQ